MTYIADPNRATGDLVTATIWNQVNENIRVLAVKPRQNLLVNGGFEVWARGAGPFTADLAYTADRWVLDENGGTGLTVARDTNSEVNSQYCAAVTVATYGAESYLYQKIEDFYGLRGTGVTFAVRVKTTTANVVRVKIFDGVGTSISDALHTGSGNYETLYVIRTISPAATKLEVYVSFLGNCTAYLDNAVLVIGPMLQDYAMLATARDIERCQRYYYDGGGSGTGDRGGMIAFFTDGTNTRVYGANAQFPTRMAGDPTVTGTNFTNNNFPVTVGITNSSPTGAYEERTANGTGHCFYITSIVAEFNP